MRASYSSTVMTCFKIEGSNGARAGGVSAPAAGVPRPVRARHLLARRFAREQSSRLVSEHTKEESRFALHLAAQPTFSLSTKSRGDTAAGPSSSTSSSPTLQAQAQADRLLLELLAGETALWPGWPRAPRRRRAAAAGPWSVMRQATHATLSSREPQLPLPAPFFLNSCLQRSEQRGGGALVLLAGEAGRGPAPRSGAIARNRRPGSCGGGDSRPAGAILPIQPHVLGLLHVVHVVAYMAAKMAGAGAGAAPVRCAAARHGGGGSGLGAGRGLGAGGSAGSSPRGLARLGSGPPPAASCCRRCRAPRIAPTQRLRCRRGLGSAW